MEKYECIKTFFINKVDDNHSLTDDQQTIEKGQLWEVEDTQYLHLAGQGGIRLVREIDELNSEWIEIYQEHLDEYFKKAG